MKQFKGFPARMEFTAIPNLFFSEVMPRIDDPAELKTTLHVMAILYRKRGYPQFVSLSELREDANLMKSLSGSKSVEETLRNALQKATERGVLLHISPDSEGTSEEIYLLNDDRGRQAIEKIKSGEISPGTAGIAPETTPDIEEMPDIFTRYEENIGMLTPLIADELKEAEKLYPQEWLRDAIKEAVTQNKRKWSYISAILQRWATEGKSDGAYQRDSKADPDRFVKGKYGHMVRR